MNIRNTLFFCFTFCYIAAWSQSTENAGWLSLSHTQKLSEKFDLLSNLQIRSADKFKYLNTLQVRAGLGYNLNDAHSVAAGYLYENNKSWEDGKTMITHENRIYEQYQFEIDVKRTQFTFRFRQEQRFIRDTGSYKFSQRSRASVAARIPLVANADFSKGLYATLQNEIFLNTQHKERDNNSIFDQNRAYVSIGYRWSKKIDTEIGYMNWRQRETDGDFSTNVCQMIISTSF